MKGLLLLALLFPTWRQEAAPSADVAVQSWVSQTAAWPGDVVEYSVQVLLAPRVELASEDLSGNGIAWEPFHLLAFARLDETRPDGYRTVTLTYRLVAVDSPESGWADIAPLRIAYVERPVGPTARTDFPVREEVVSGPRIAFRSTLERPVEAATIRDGKALEVATLPGRTLVWIGLSGLLVGVYPLARSAYPIARQLLSRPRVLEAHGKRKHLREELAALHSIRLEGPDDYERLYRGIYDGLREHLTNRFGIAYPGLTSLDSDELQKAGVPGEEVQRIEALVEECEQLRYGKQWPEDAGQRARRALTSFEQLVAV